MKSISENGWPELNFEAFKDTLETVHLWTQIVGKIRLRKTPWINHSWHVTLKVSPLGLTTGSIPFENGMFEIEFDFINDLVLITLSSGKIEKMQLYARTVSDFYQELMGKLKDLGVDVGIYAAPNEIEPAIRFDQDVIHRSYVHSQIHSFWEILVRVNNIFTEFRAGFIGKCSPVHFFWGGFDLAVTRFSGRTAPKYPGSVPNIPARVMQEAYSHEVSSCGFWPGNAQYPQAAFYSYCYPTPDDFGSQPIMPKEAFFSKDLGEFLLNYDVVLDVADPAGIILQFLQSTYEAAALTGHWDRSSLEEDFSSMEK
ncbi:MAG: DUF5996 family protein [Ginsengibacter sp.]